MAVNDERYAPAAVTPPLNRKLLGGQVRCGKFGEIKNVLSLPGFEIQTY